jgi:hypothetical protein
MALAKKEYREQGEKTVKALQRRNFAADYCDTAQEALTLALSLIEPTETVSWGGSVTIQQIGLLDAVRQRFSCIDRDTAQTPEERAQLMREALLADTFLMSANAISEDGQLFNIDGNGNRVAALCYGPKRVIVVAGMNKVEPTAEAAECRARTVAAPANMKRFPGSKTPCSATGECGDCTSPDCICVQLVQTRMSRPAGRIHVILVGEELGF